MSPTEVRPVPDGYHTLTPHLTVRPAAQAIEFYAKAFGAKELARTPGPGGSILNAQLSIGGSMLLLNDPSPDFDALAAPSDAGHTTAVMHLYVPDCDAVFAAATKAGAAVVLPLTDMFWGDRYGLVRDPFGHVWAVATRVESPTPEQIAERMAAMGSR